MRILFASHSAAVGPFRVGSHHLARELARRGHAVVHLSSPLSVGHLAKVKDPVVRARVDIARRGPQAYPAGDVHILPVLALPVSPGGAPGWVLKSGPWRRQVERALGGEPEVILLDKMSLYGIFEVYPRALRVVRSTDLETVASRITALGRAVAVADALVGTSEPALRQLARESDSLPSLLLRNGVDLRHFSSTDPASERAGAVYVGAIDARFGWEEVVAAAQAHPDLAIDLWGPVTARPATTPPANIRLRGPIDYEDVPSIFSASRFGLLPLSNDPSNSGRSPMKLYEYLAAGLTVVTSKIDGIEDLSGRGVVVAEAPGMFAAAVGDALEGAGGQADQEQVAAQDWPAKAEQLEKFLVSLSRRP